MPDVIEYCLANVDGPTRDALAAVDCRVEAAPCLQRCNTCHADRYLIVDGAAVVGEDADDVLEGGADA